MKNVFSTAILFLAGMTMADPELHPIDETVVHAKMRAIHERAHVNDYARQVEDSGDKLLDFRLQGTVEKLKEEGLELLQGESIMLVMSENPSTGYSW